MPHTIIFDRNLFGNRINDVHYDGKNIRQISNDEVVNSDFYLNSEEINNQAARIKAQVVSNADADLSAVISEMNRGIALWKYCIMLALFFIAIEILLLRFLK